MKSRIKRLILLFLASLSIFVMMACQDTTISQDTTTSDSTISTSQTISNTSTTISTSQTISNTSTTTSQSNTISNTTSGGVFTRITYDAQAIRQFGSGTPAGMASYIQNDNTVAIWNVDASLDNYGGVQTPTIALDFSKAVIFQMEVKSVYSQYIVKLAVAGESEYYYVLADEVRSGLISINVVDAMLSEKFENRNTQPDPGYATGWKYDNQIKNCSFHILAKGPDGEKQTAELIIENISISNDQTPITGVNILSNQIANNKITQLKNAQSVQLSAEIIPSTAEDSSVFWISADESIASVDENGFVSFVGVGITKITAISALDQSKSASVTVDVQSGYENVTTLKNRLSELSYHGSTTSTQAFKDLFKTTWSENMSQIMVPSVSLAMTSRNDGTILTLDNYFTASNSSHVNEAEANMASGQAFLPLNFEGIGSATVYRNIDGKLFMENYTGSLGVAYATKSSTWSKNASYIEQGIVVWENGNVKKYEIHIVSAKMIGHYFANDMANSTLWTIPDRTKQLINPVVHALSPASIMVSNQLAIIKQAKYPESKYCFGGIASNILQSEASKSVQIILDVVALNQKNNYVKTMWEVKIIYYQADGQTVVSTNPLKLASGNSTGVQVITFTPAYQYFRLYLVVNGSDIGEQFADAEMQIRSLKIHSLD
jgi:hypothetical protein